MTKGKDLVICKYCHEIVERNHHDCPVQKKEQVERNKRNLLREKDNDYNKILRTKRWYNYRKEILRLDNGMCQRCWIKLHIRNYDNLTIHHIIPKVTRPDLIFVPDNCITLCQSCNSLMGLNGIDFDWNPEMRQKYEIVL